MAAFREMRFPRESEKTVLVLRLIGKDAAHRSRYTLNRAYLVYMPRLGCNLDAKVGKWVGRLVLNFSSSSLLANR